MGWELLRILEVGNDISNRNELYCIGCKYSDISGIGGDDTGNEWES